MKGVGLVAKSRQHEVAPGGDSRLAGLVCPQRPENRRTGGPGGRGAVTATVQSRGIRQAKGCGMGGSAHTAQAALGIERPSAADLIEALAYLKMFRHVVEPVQIIAEIAEPPEMQLGIAARQTERAVDPECDTAPGCRGPAA